MQPVKVRENGGKSIQFIPHLRLKESVAALRAAPRAPAASAEERTGAERAKARILQFLHLDRENEQLLLRHSLSPRPPPAEALASVAHLQRAYQPGVGK